MPAFICLQEKTLKRNHGFESNPWGVFDERSADIAEGLLSSPRRLVTVSGIRIRAMLEIIQAYGRAVRAEDDAARFYVVDGSCIELIKSSWRFISDWFKDALPSSPMRWHSNPPVRPNSFNAGIISSLTAMFHSIPKPVEDRMRYLEEIDCRDRTDGTPHAQRLRQVPPETGRFIALLSSIAPRGLRIEIGTSGGYSTLWLALAQGSANNRIVTFETLDAKAKIAKETFKVARVENLVELVVGDARHYIHHYDGIGFCFLDAEKEVYLDCYEAVVPRLVFGGLLAADNVISHGDALQPFLNKALGDERVDSLVIPIGKGVLVSRKI